MEEVLVYVITHKEFERRLPKNYVKLMVGSWNKPRYEGYLQDCVGEHISEKNPYYCELTGLYWMWKNDKTDIIGLCHYRRYFIQWVGVPISSKKIKKILAKKDMILPYKRRLQTSMYEEYGQEHYSKDLDNCEKVIQEYYPEYLEDYKTVMGQKEMYFCNMFIGKKEIMDEYCAWLFGLLEKVEAITDLTDYDDYQKRIYGFLAERLFNVWIHHKKPNIEEMDIWITEKSKLKEWKRILKRRWKGRKRK